MRLVLAFSFVCLFSTGASLTAFAEEAVPTTVTASMADVPVLGRESDSKGELNSDSNENLKNETKVAQAESEIPLNLDANKKNSTNENPFLRIILSFGLLAIVGTGAFIFLKKYAKPTAFKNQTQIKVLQQHYLGPKKSLAIIRVAGESLLIGVTDHNISMIKSLSLLDDEVPEEAPAHFSNLVSRFSKAEELTEDESEFSATRIEKEDFSFGGIKDIVAKRLKGMRNLE